MSAWRQAGVNPFWDREVNYLRVDVDGVARKVNPTVSQQSDRRPFGNGHIPIDGLQGLTPVGPARFTIPNDLQLHGRLHCEDGRISARRKEYTEQHGLRETTSQ